MTTDLGSLFRSAQAAAATWRREDVRQALEFLAGSEFQIDWEPGDEEWGRIIDSGGSCLALICARVPLGIGNEYVDPGRLAARIFWMKVHSMSEHVFEVDRRLLEEVFGRQLSDNVDYSKLSVDELWWATVS